MTGSPLKPLSSTNPGKAPLFVVHPFTGDVICYLEFADRLKSRFTVFGLQSPGLEAAAAPPVDIESLAAGYLRFILKLQKEGPFSLCGWSAGGCIALEMGRQLQEQGHSQVQVTMLDAWKSNTKGDVPLDGALILSFVSSYLELSLRRRLQVSWAALAGLNDRDAVAEAVQCLVRQGAVKGALLAESVRRLFAVCLANIRASLSYRPEKVACSTTLFRAGRALTPDKRKTVALGQSFDLGDFFCLDDDSNGWNRVCTRLNTKVLPADHYSILNEPSLTTIATHLFNFSASA